MWIQSLVEQSPVDVNVRGCEMFVFAKVLWFLSPVDFVEAQASRPAMVHPAQKQSKWLMGICSLCKTRNVRGTKSGGCKCLWLLKFCVC